MLVLPKISIIVPVYNVEKYLKQCIDSILLQSFQNWECILVDDGSVDNSGNICDEYATKDSRIQVVHKKNGGVCSARNIGLLNANGEWIYFVDSDDILYPNALSLFDEMTLNSVDAIMAGYTVSPEYYDRIILKNIQNKYSIKSIRDALMEMYMPTDFSYQGYLWCKLFKKSIIVENSLQFNEAISFNEDRLFIVEYLCKCKNPIAYTTNPVYGYVNRSSGAMGSLQKKYNPRFITDFEAFIQMYNMISSYTSDSQLLACAKEGIAYSFQQNMALMEKFNAFDKEAYKYMRKKMKKINGVKCLILAPLRVLVGNLLRVYCPAIIVKVKN